MCRELLNIIPNSIILHGGNLYRGIVYSLMNSSENEEYDLEHLSKELDNVDILTLMDRYEVEIRLENNETVVYSHNVKIKEEELQSDRASMAVSIAGKAANNKNLFVYIRKLIDDWKKDYNVIISGRSIMKIYPDVDYHFFVTASLDVRVDRKFKQYEGNIDKQELKNHISKRDKLQEEAGFYDLDKKTIILDVTNCKSAKESTLLLLKHINKDLSLV